MDHPTQIATTARGPVEYCAAGDGEVILYLHGTGGTGDGMLPFESELIEDGFRLLLPNRPGYGKTPLAAHISAVDCSDVIAALLDTLNIQRVAVMGSSGGGTFALSFARTYPERCHSLTLLCPQLHRWSSPQWMPHAGRWSLPFLKRSLLRKLMMAAHRAHFSRMTAAQFLRMEAGARYDDVKHDQHALQVARDALAMMKRGVRHPGFENDMRIFVSEDVFSPGDQLQPPSMMLHDQADPMAPVAQVDWFCNLVPSCQRVDVVTAGHLVWAGRDRRLVHESRVRFLREALLNRGPDST